MQHAIGLARFSPQPRKKATEHTDAYSIEKARRDSVDGQREAIQEYCNENKMLLVEFFFDKYTSGKDGEDKGDRPGLWDAISELRRGSVLVVRNVDRIARNSSLLAYVLRAIHAKGATLHSVEDGGEIGHTPDSRLFLTIIGAIAQYQRELGNARQRAANRRKERALISVNGSFPFGWMKKPGERLQMIEHPEEQAVIREVFRMREGGMSFRCIAGQLNKHPTTIHRGKRWDGTMVRKMMHRFTRVTGQEEDQPQEPNKFGTSFP